MGYTEYQRQSLINQYELMMLLSDLKEGNDTSEISFDDIKVRLKALREGYTDYYDGEGTPLSDEVSEETQNDVYKLLNMYRFIQSGISKSKQTMPEFYGYDANEQSSHYSFMSFLLNDLNAYSDVKERLEDNLNTHGFDGDRDVWLKRYKELTAKERHDNPGASIDYILTGQKG
ncbi:YfbU family protein [Weissella hellenica]|uniref:YfbU family protein n=1 Tax=Weissella hellenica TaxID=46256 RepID=UPI00388AC072